MFHTSCYIINLAERKFSAAASTFTRPKKGRIVVYIVYITLLIRTLLYNCLKYYKIKKKRTLLKKILLGQLGKLDEIYLHYILTKSQVVKFIYYL